MGESILYGVVWFTLVGLLLFSIMYAFLSPWRDPMGRHILIFMMALGIAFAYLIIAPSLETRNARILGWNIVIGLVAIVVWWRVVILIIFQIKHREFLYNQLVKLINKIKGRKDAS